MSEIDLALRRMRPLVKKFKSGEHRYKSARYSEENTRIDFIDKFWIALGWDVKHEHQTNPKEQEVIIERSIATTDSQYCADYTFYLVPDFQKVQFFVNTEKPIGVIETKENYFQLIQIGWKNKTPLAVLTDFEQFHILDCRYKPDPATVLNRAIAKYHYTDYIDLEKFAEIYWLFSHEAVAAGSLEKRAKELPELLSKTKKC